MLWGRKNWQDQRRAAIRRLEAEVEEIRAALEGLPEVLSRPDEERHCYLSVSLEEAETRLKDRREETFEDAIDDDVLDRHRAEPWEPRPCLH